ncbi:murein biosynthesis integral membrane protein MurJ [Actinotalea sp. BY-33]|uniref:Probable lipid II flippase MurJ n=1 Tax=Actinotalea soli TaxID=2819234 RepID=A0A939LSQ8_9CELL|nr:murein biosynthesis integral membrane protein MurJ [Actinotalea soli]MBO1753418.1 murein biosynthesis integral membrane protein MurJ [Actinotalea soli]
MADRPGRWSIARAAVLVTGLTAFSTILGFGRDVVIAAVFGAGPSLDAYLVAQGLMNLVLALVAGAMARSVIPVTAREAAIEDAAGGRCRGHRGFDVALTVTMAVLGIGAVLMGILAAPVTSLLAPGFGPEQAELTASLTRVVLVATVLIAGTNMLAALAQAHGRFTWSALEGVPFNLVMITAAGLFGPRHGVLALAVGFVLGSGARLLLQLPPLRHLGRVRPSMALRDPAFQEVARLVPAMLVGTAVVNINTLVDRAVASTLAEGSITAISYGWRLVHLPEALIITALLVPLYPALGAAATNKPELRRLVGRGMSVTVTVLTPLSVALAVAAHPAVTVAFGHGAFDAPAVASTAGVVVWFAPGLLALGIRQVVVRASYAIGDRRSPVVVSLVAVAVNVVGDVVLAPVMGAPGIALATSVSLIVAGLVNAWLLHRHHAAMPPVGALMARAAVLAVLTWLVGTASRDALPSAPALVVGAVVGLVVCGAYVVGLWLLRAPERTLPWEMLRAARRRP